MWRRVQGALRRRLRRLAGRPSEGVGDELLTSERWVPEFAPDVPWADACFERYQWASCFLAAEDSVLDIACGPGYGSDILAERCHSVTGVDRSAASIEYARRTYGRPRFELGDVLEFAASGRRFDVVVSIETLEHIEASLYDVLASLISVARKRVIGSVPYREPWKHSFHRHFFLSENDFEFLHEHGQVTWWYQEREPGHRIERQLDDPQNLVFVLDLKAD